MKVKKLEIFWNKISSTGSKWSSLNAPSTETPVSHSIWHLLGVNGAFFWDSLSLLIRRPKKEVPRFVSQSLRFAQHYFELRTGNWSLDDNFWPRFEV